MYCSKENQMFLFLQILRKKFLLPVIIVIVLISCTKDDRHPVPFYPVDFIVNIESTQNIELNSIGGWAYYTGGFRGIIIYRAQEDEFTAFDRACPYHPYSECRIIVEDPPLARGSDCESVFLLLDGSPVSGPSKHPLRAYRTSFSYPYLHVTN